MTSPTQAAVTPRVWRKTTRSSAQLITPRTPRPKQRTAGLAQRPGHWRQWRVAFGRVSGADGIDHGCPPTSRTLRVARAVTFGALEFCAPACPWGQRKRAGRPIGIATQTKEGEEVV